MNRTELTDFVVLNLGHAVTSHHWSNADISSPFIRLFYVRNGNAVFHLPEGDVNLSGGKIYMLPPYIPHSYQCSPGCDFFYLFVYHQSHTANNIFELYNFPMEVEALPAVELLFENFCAYYQQLHLPTRDAEDFLNHQSYRDYAQAFMEMPFYKRMQLYGLVAIIFSYFMKFATPKVKALDSRVAPIIDSIQQHIGEPLPVGRLADEVCMSKLNFIRVFKRVMSTTPLQYVLKKKIQHSQSLLLGTELSIKAIATAAGFDDVSYFIRLFKQKLGFTPQEYRDNLIG